MSTTPSARKKEAIPWVDSRIVEPGQLRRFLIL
jgi:hypothetical protein